MEKGLEFEVGLRRAVGKSSARKARRKGKIPGIVYGKGRVPLPIEVDPLIVQKILHSPKGRNSLLLLRSDAPELDGINALIRDFQEDKLGKGLLHIDLWQIKLDEPLKVDVRLELVGSPLGVKLGGTLEQLLWEASVKCLPTNIPEKIEVDVSGLSIGHSVHIKDISLPEGIEMLTDKEMSVATVVAPKILVEEVAGPSAGEAVGAGEAEPASAKEEKPSQEKEK